MQKITPITTIHIEQAVQKIQYMNWIVEITPAYWANADQIRKGLKILRAHSYTVEDIQNALLAAEFNWAQDTTTYFNCVHNSTADFSFMTLSVFSLIGNELAINVLEKNGFEQTGLENVIFHLQTPAIKYANMCKI